jgi:hypothetical protein
MERQKHANFLYASHSHSLPLNLFNTALATEVDGRKRVEILIELIDFLLPRLHLRSNDRKTSEIFISPA